MGTVNTINRCPTSPGHPLLLGFCGHTYEVAPTLRGFRRVGGGNAALRTSTSFILLPADHFPSGRAAPSFSRPWRKGGDLKSIRTAAPTHPPYLHQGFEAEIPPL